MIEFTRKIRIDVTIMLYLISGAGSLSPSAPNRIHVTVYINVVSKKKSPDLSFMIITYGSYPHNNVALVAIYIS